MLRIYIMGSMYLCIFYGVEYFKNLKFVRKSLLSLGIQMYFTQKFTFAAVKLPAHKLFTG